MTDLLAILSFHEDGLSRSSLRAMHWNAAVLIALIIALLSTTARKHTCSPFGPYSMGTVRKGLLVCAMIGFPKLSSRYTSVTLLLGVATSPFVCVVFLCVSQVGVVWVFCVCAMWGEMAWGLCTVCMCLSYVSELCTGSNVGGKRCGGVTAGLRTAVTPGHFPFPIHSLGYCPSMQHPVSHCHPMCLPS